MSNVFFAMVPLSIINIINFVIANDLTDNDFYLVDDFPGAFEKAEKIKETGLFNHVYLLKDVLLTYPVTMKKILKIVKNKHDVFKKLKGKKYDNVYYTTDGWLINSIFYSALKKLNKNAKHIFIESGLNPYIKAYNSKEWYLRFFINIQGMTCMDDKYVDERYLYKPKALCVKQNGEIKKMPALDKNNEKLKNIINNIFDYDNNKNEFKDKKIIILEQPPSKADFDVISLWENIGNLIDKKAAIIKPHPRQQNSVLSKLGMEICENHTVPWELVTLNSDIENKILIAIFSTSCVAPKLMFDEEPTVIFLYKLLKADYSVIGPGMFEFVNKASSLYKDNKKFFVPNSFEEFKKFLENR